MSLFVNEKSTSPARRRSTPAVSKEYRPGAAGTAVTVKALSSTADSADDELDEASFLTEILDRTGALLLLDIANVYANARNRGTDPLDLLDHLPLDRVAYVPVHVS